MNKQKSRSKHLEKLSPQIIVDGLKTQKEIAMEKLSAKDKEFVEWLINRAIDPRGREAVSENPLLALSLLVLNWENYEEYSLWKSFLPEVKRIIKILEGGD